MAEIKRSDIKDNERVELSVYFDVFSHGNGFQLKREDNYYSIIPIKKAREKGFGQEIGWEVNNDKNRFDSLIEAIKYVLDEEGVSVKVHSIQEFYGMNDGVDSSER